MRQCWSRLISNLDTPRVLQILPIQTRRVFSSRIMEVYVEKEDINYHEQMLSCVPFVIFIKRCTTLLLSEGACGGDGIVPRNVINFKTNLFYVFITLTFDWLWCLCAGFLTKRDLRHWIRNTSGRANTRVVKILSDTQHTSERKIVQGTAGQHLCRHELKLRTIRLPGEMLLEISSPRKFTQSTISNKRVSWFPLNDAHVDNSPRELFASSFPMETKLYHKKWPPHRLVAKWHSLSSSVSVSFLCLLRYMIDIYYIWPDIVQKVLFVVGPCMVV